MIRIVDSKGASKQGYIVREYESADGVTGYFFTVTFKRRKEIATNKVNLYFMPDESVQGIFNDPTWRSIMSRNLCMMSGTTIVSASGTVRCMLYGTQLSVEEADERVKDLTAWHLHRKEFLIAVKEGRVCYSKDSAIAAIKKGYDSFVENDFACGGCYVAK